ncbi:MAG: ABC transporter substrate-binding protein [Alphaproteobacteria bacterium]|nr:MAG: ABC transporter substrate-binding protein [Alphaproteobacteria bacterium]
MNSNLSQVSGSEQFMAAVISAKPRTPGSPLSTGARACERSSPRSTDGGTPDSNLAGANPAGAARYDVKAMSNGGDAMRTIRSMALGAIVAITAALCQSAAAQDKVKVGVFPTASSLPYFVAIERGFFKEQNIEPETIRLIGGPANIAAMISNQIEAAIVLVTIEAMNANVKKPGVAMYIGVHSQSKIYQMEQFVVRTGYPAGTLKDLKGARIMSAPGPANLVAAKAVLAKVGLNEGDYTIDQLDMSQHVNVMTSGTFDAGYTLEPQASTMRKLGVARTLEAGVIAKYILGDEDGNAFAAGCAVTSDFIKSRPDVARRFAAVWKKGIDFVNNNPQEARKYLAKNTLTPEDVVDTVPMVRYYMAGELTDKHKAEFQKFIDFSTSVGTLPERVDVTKFLQAY